MFRNEIYTIELSKTKKWYIIYTVLYLLVFLRTCSTKTSFPTNHSADGETSGPIDKKALSSRTPQKGKGHFSPESHHQHPTRGDSTMFQCPLLCVQSSDSCPSGRRPQSTLDQPPCPPPLLPCSDGQCHTSCTGIINACWCYGENYFPCLGSPNITQEQKRKLVIANKKRPTIYSETQHPQSNFQTSKEKSYFKEIKLPRRMLSSRQEEMILLDTCMQLWEAEVGGINWTESGGQGPNIVAWNLSTLNQCPAFASVMMISLRDIPVLLLLVYVSLTAILLLGFWAYKNFKEKDIPRQVIVGTLLFPHEKMGLMTKESEEENIECTQILIDGEYSFAITGYKGCKLGTFCYGLGLSLTILCQLLLFLMVLDQCRLLRYIFPSLLLSDMVLGNEYTLQLVFAVVWHISLGWLWYSKRVGLLHRNFFRLKVGLRSSQCVAIHVFKTRPKTKNTQRLSEEGTSLCIMILNRISTFFCATPTLGNCVRVLTDSEERFLYFDFYGVRYVFDEGRNRFVSKEFGNKMLFKESSWREGFEEESVRNPKNKMVIYQEKGVIEKGNESSEPTVCIGINGLSSAESERRLRNIGPNKYFTLPVSSIIKELSHSMYLYFLMLFWLWMFMDYKGMAAIQLCFVYYIFMVKYSIECKMLKQGRIMMGQSRSTCNVLRNEIWQSVDTTQLVPGDILEVKSGEFPCDALLLSGNVIMDESRISGKSCPTTLVATTTLYNKRQITSSLIKDGSTISHTSSTGSNTICALVLNTGMRTGKGRMLQSTLFKQSFEFSLSKELQIAYLLQASISGMCYIIWLCMSFYSSLQGTKSSFSARAMIISKLLNALFLLSRVFSPLLLPVVYFSYVNSAKALRSKGIVSIAPTLIQVWGKVKILCLDKTGTITSGGMKLEHILSAVKRLPSSKVDEDASDSNGEDLELDDKTDFNSTPQLTKPTTHLEEVPPLMQMAMASCHNLSREHNKLKGHPVEVELFQASKWLMVEKRVTREGRQESMTAIKFTPPLNKELHLPGPLILIRSVPFESNHPFSCSIVQDLSTLRIHAFIKGPCEFIATMCQSSTLPDTLLTTNVEEAKQGYYTLAYGHREIMISEDVQDIKEENHIIIVPNLDTIDEIGIEYFQANIKFLGLVSLRDTIKFGIDQILLNLRQGGCKLVMLSGDNPYSCIAIALRAGIIDSAYANKIYISRMSSLDPSEVEWVCWETGQCVKSLSNLLKIPNIQLVITGMALPGLLKKESVDRMIQRVRIFARVTPDYKVVCIHLMKRLGCVAMCGDGENDGPAMKAANVGVSLGNDDKETVFAPFMATHGSLICLVDLIKQGRDTLANTLNCYQLGILTGQLVLLSGFAQMYWDITISSGFWFFMDTIFLIYLLTFVTSKAPSYRRLQNYLPRSQLLGGQGYASIIGKIIFMAIFLSGGLLLITIQSWYAVPSNAEEIPWWAKSYNYVSAALGSMMSYQLLHFGISLHLDRMYQSSPQPALREKCVTITIFILAYVGISYITLGDSSWVTCLFQVNCSSGVTTQNLTMINYRVGACLLGVLHGCSVFAIDIMVLYKEEFEQWMDRKKWSGSLSQEKEASFQRFKKPLEALALV